MTGPSRPAAPDDGYGSGTGYGSDTGYGFGDITASSISTSSVLSSAPGDPQAARRSAAVESDRRDALVRVAEHAAEIGLESAGALAAAAGVRLPARDTPAAHGLEMRRPAAAQPRRLPAPNARAQLVRRSDLPPQRPPQAALPGPQRPRRGEAGLGGRVVRMSEPPARVGQPASRPPARVVPGARVRRGPWLALAMLALVVVLVARALIR